MSLSTALIGGVGGAIIGFFTGGSTGALQGLQVGTFVGGLIDANKSPTIIGPRLSDLTVQTSTYGAVIPRAYGTVALCGNVFWLENNQLKEVATTNKSSGGKGGGGGSEYETFAYYATFAVGLCKGPIIGVKRIWIGRKLIYDAGSLDYNSIRESNSSSGLFTVHTGSNTQLADDRMQATLGAANTPAYRGLAYLVFKDLPLRDYGNSLAGAQIKAEIVSNGSIQEYSIQSVNHGLPTAIDLIWDGNQFITINQVSNSNLYSTSPDGITWTVRSCPGVQGVNAICALGTNEKFTLAQWSYQTGVWKTTDGRVWKQITGSWSNYWSFCKVGDKMMMFPREYHGAPTISSDGNLWLPAGTFTPYGSFPANCPVANDKVAVACSSTHHNIYVYNISANSWKLYPQPASYTIGFSSVAWMPNIGKWFFINQSNQTALTSDFINWELHTGPSSGWGSCYYRGDRLFIGSNSNKFYWTKDGINWSMWTISPSIIMYDICYNEGVLLLQGLSYISLRILQNTLSTTVPTLSSIVQSECLNSKFLVAGDIDVTLLSKTVKGYVLSSVAAIRAALAPLQGAFQFDIIQSGYKIKFKPRGNSSVVTIPAKDLGAEGLK